MTTAETKKVKKVGDAVLKYTRVSPVTNIFISALFIILALLCLMPALLVLIGYITHSFINSLGITLVGTVIGLVLCSTMGYALSRPNYRLRNFFTWFIFIPMLFSGGLVASYMINTQILGMKNTYAALVFPMCCSSSYIIVMRTFFQTSVPDAIIESAKIDGARQIRIFAQIVLPISLPAIATIGLFYTFAYWNDWMLAMYYLNTNRQDLFPMQYVLINLENNIDFYPFFQKYFISGLTIGAVKG